VYIVHVIDMSTGGTFLQHNRSADDREPAANDAGVCTSLRAPHQES